MTKKKVMLMLNNKIITYILQVSHKYITDGLPVITWGLFADYFTRLGYLEKSNGKKKAVVRTLFQLTGIYISLCYT